MGSTQASKAPNARLRKTVSALHQASVGFLGCIHHRRSLATCHCCQARALGMPGGLSSTIGFCEGKFAKAGATSASSPLPRAWLSTSIRLPKGHPRPGSHRSSSSCAVWHKRAGGAGCWLARQTPAGRALARGGPLTDEPDVVKAFKTMCCITSMSISQTQPVHLLGLALACSPGSVRASVCASVRASVRALAVTFEPGWFGVKILYKYTVKLTANPLIHQPHIKQ